MRTRSLYIVMSRVHDIFSLYSGYKSARDAAPLSCHTHHVHHHNVSQNKLKQNATHCKALPHTVRHARRAATLSSQLHTSKGPLLNYILEKHGQNVINPPTDTLKPLTHCNTRQHTATNCNTLQHTPPTQPSDTLKPLTHSAPLSKLRIPS